MREHRETKTFFPLLFLLVFLPACGLKALVGITVVDERTALENQILGTYEELAQDVLLLASVRSIDAKGRLVELPEIPPDKKKTIRALQRSSFNRDDLLDFKARGVLGENNQGGLALLREEALAPDEQVFVRNLINEENADRETVMRRIIETTEGLSERELPDVRRMFTVLNRDMARSGDKIQRENGEWTTKE
jgi:hypothetical protein